MKRTITTALLIAACMLGGCAQIVANKYQTTLQPQLGKMTKDHYVKSWGPPESTTEVSDGEVCVWKMTYGMRAVGNGSYFANQYGGNLYTNAAAHEMYDRLVMTFDEGGVLVNYQLRVQR